jgi:hypothetical protein
MLYFVKIESIQRAKLNSRTVKKLQYQNKALKKGMKQSTIFRAKHIATSKNSTSAYKQSF